MATLCLERHCQKALFKAGWKLVEGWESTYRHPDLGLIRTIYADDFKMAGRSENLQKGWGSITKAGICLDPPQTFWTLPWARSPDNGDDRG